MKTLNPHRARAARMARRLIRAATLSAAVAAATLFAHTHAIASGSATTPGTATADSKLIARGRYLAIVAGCNDCHTPGYSQSAGAIPESNWLTGDSFGWRGAWGTTYAPNLRRYLAAMSQEQWIKTARTLESRPPMPWFNLRKMTDQDLKAIYQYTRSLGAAGAPAPAYVPPDKTPPQPYAQFPG